MELVFEITNRAGRALEVRRLAGDRFTIGRAYDNDLIVPDETVSPHHAVIETGSDGRLVLKDLDSLNGVHTPGHERIVGQVPVTSGATYLFGRARVRVYDPQHPVPAAVSVGGMYQIARRLGETSTMLAVLVIVTAVVGLDTWLSTFGEFKWLEAIRTLFSIFGAAFGVALVWGLIGRVIKHEAHLRSHFIVLLLFLLAFYVTLFVRELLLVNTMNSILTTAVIYGILFVILSATLAANLYIATHQSRRQRWSVAAMIAIVPIAVGIFLQVAALDEYSPLPSYVREVMPPMFRVKGGVSPETYVEAAGEVFDKAVID